ncbi:MAG: hypothetical protein AB7R90_07825 [Reyranellaceae bacterium]
MQKGLGIAGIAGFVLATVLVGWLSGRLDQRIFDDEAMSLAAIDGKSYAAIAAFYLQGGDVHPPLPFLWLRLMQDLQFPLWLQRLLALAGAAAGFALVLDLVWRRRAERAIRIAAVVLFLGAPLLYGMGASLRWYPLLVPPVALALWSMERAGRPTLLAAIGFGLAANISFLAAIPATAYGIWRYLIVRRFEAASDGPFIAVAAVIALPALIAFVAALGHLPAQADSNVLVALGTTALGVLGGYGLGLTHSFIAIPLALLLLAGLVAAAVAVWRSPADGLPAMSLLVLLLCLALTLTGFAKPRSFLFAVPFLLAAAVLGGTRLGRWHAPALAAAGLGVVLASLWLLNASDRPFKRNLHIPDEPVLAMIRQHASRGTALIVSSDPSLGWRLRQEGYCVIAASLPGGCERATAPVVVTIDDGTFTQRPGFSANLGRISSQHRLVQQRVFGDDEDGPTKTFLAGRLVPKFLVSVAVYSRD